ncbi:MAG: alpha-L-fucosidase, partial [Bacteroidota bacterium]|nr:alpha-L-fucosidase [Bacteroidota bacterium]
TASMSDYIDKVAVPQVKELLSNYGKVSVLWWDTPTNMTDEYAQKLQAVLKIQPGIITNDRLKHPNFPGDTKTPEQKIPDLKELDGKYWETCMTMNGSWGFKSYDHNWKSTEMLVRNLIDIASKGGNYLLNIGPKSDGEFPEESIQRLAEIGKWMKVNGEAIYATQSSPLQPLSWGRCTRKDGQSVTTLYLSVFEWPKEGKLIVPGLKNQVISAKFLANGKLLKTSLTNDGLSISLPLQAPDNIASVIKVEVKGKIKNAVSSEINGKMKTGELD